MLMRKTLPRELSQRCHCHFKVSLCLFVANVFIVCELACVRRPAEMTATSLNANDGATGGRN